MPKKLDHQQERAELAKMAPDALRAFSIRLPAGLLIQAHRFAEEKHLDLTNAIRELTALGLEAAAQPEALSPADLKEVKKWETILERALRQGQSPLEPLLEQLQSPFEPSLKQSPPDWKIVAAALARLDLARIFHDFEEKRRKETFLERMWTKLKDEAQPFVRERMEALDRLEPRFLARKQLDYELRGNDEEERPLVCWLLSEDLMGKMNDPAAEADFKAVKELIAARYLVPRYPQADPHTAWNLEWNV